MADYIMNGEPPHQLLELDPGRFQEHWTKPEYTKTKVREAYSHINATLYPHEERFAGIMTSPYS